jgi:hypothetical protein
LNRWSCSGGSLGVSCKPISSVDKYFCSTLENDLTRWVKKGFNLPYDVNHFLQQSSWTRMCWDCCYRPVLHILRIISTIWARIKNKMSSNHLGALCEQIQFSSVHFPFSDYCLCIFFDFSNLEGNKLQLFTIEPCSRIFGLLSVFTFPPSQILKETNLNLSQ